MAASPLDSTERDSILKRGDKTVEGDDQSSEPSVSADGRFVAFTSSASNLVDGDDNNATDVFVYDRREGTTTFVSSRAKPGPAPATAGAATPASTPTTVSDAVRGSSFGVSVDTLLGPLLTATPSVSGSATKPENGFGPLSKSILAIRGVVSVGVAEVSAAGDDVAGGDHLGHVTSSAKLAQVNLADILSAEVVSSTCRSDGDGSTGFTQLIATAGGKPLLGAPGPNTQIALAGLATITLNEQIVSNNPGSTSITVNAVHITTLAVAGRPVLDVILAQSTCNASGALKPRPDQPGDRASSQPSISADGRFVAFASEASNLVGAAGPGAAVPTYPDSHPRNVFLRDLQGRTTRLVSATVGGDGQPHPAGGEHPAISADGGSVAFSSAAPVPGVDPGLLSVARSIVTAPAWQVFVWQAGKDPYTQPMSVPTGASANDGDSGRDSRAAISANGRFVAFESAATNLVDGDTNARPDVFVHDRDPDGDGVFDEFPYTVANRKGTIRLVSVSSDGTQLAGTSVEPSISGDGRLVAFASNASPDGKGEVACSDILVRDRDLDGNGRLDEPGTAKGTTARLTKSTSAREGDGCQRAPAISADGQWVAWQSRLEKVVPAPKPPPRTTTTTLSVLVPRALGPPVVIAETAPKFFAPTSLRGQASPDVALGGSVTDTVTLTGGEHPTGTMTFRLFPPDDTRCTGAPAFTRTRAVSGNGGYTSDPVIPTAQGLYRWTAAYSGDADNNPSTTNCNDATSTVAINPGETIEVTSQVFARPVAGGDIEQVSVDSARRLADRPSVAPAISATGRAIGFSSLATNLVAEDRNDRGDVFVRERPPTLSISPDLAEYGTVLVGSPSTLTLTPRNVGATPVSITGVTISGANAADFSLSPGSCVATLARGAACTLTVTFTPASLGPRTAELVVHDDAPDSPQRVRLVGTGAQPRPEIAPSTVDFGNQAVGSTSSDKPITVTNGGGLPLVVTKVSVEGPDATAFAKTGDTCTGATLPAAAACNVRMAFAPPAPAGERRGTLLITDNATASPQSVPLKGNGVVAAIEVNPNAADFGSQQLFEATQQVFTATSTGDVPLTIMAVAIAGTGGGDFEQATDGCSGRILAKGEACGVTVIFRPTRIGARSNELLFADNADPGFARVPLSGVGLVPPSPALAVTPNPVDFGPLKPGASKSVTLTATSVGRVPISISAVSLDAAGKSAFALPGKGDTCTGRKTELSPGQSCTVVVKLTAPKGALRPTDIVFTDGARDSPQRVPLQATPHGGPAIIVDPPIATPGSVVTVTGTGFAPEAPVTLGWSRGIGLGSAMTDKEGKFSADMVLFYRDDLGPRLLQATDDRGGAASATVLVVPGSVMPDGFKVRR